MAVAGKMLFLEVTDQKALAQLQQSEKAIANAKNRHWSDKDLVPRLQAIDTTTGKLLWSKDNTYLLTASDTLAVLLNGGWNREHPGGG